jgi:hypothetical protein
MSNNREKFDARKWGADTIRGSVPIKKYGTFWGTLLKNAGVGAADEALASYVQSGEVDGMGVGGAGALTGGLSSLGRLGGSVNRRVAQGQELASTRGRDGSVLLSEVAPSMDATETMLASKGDKLVQESLNNLDVGLADLITRDFPNLVSTTEVATELGRLTRQVEPLRKAAQSAAAASRKADEALNAFRTNASVAAPAAVKKAKELALEAIKSKAAYEGAVKNAFGETLPDLSEMARGRRMERSAAMVEASDGVTSAKLNELYGAAGIGPNQPIASRKDIEGFLRAAGRPGKKLEGKVARARIRAEIDNAFTDGETITREQYEELRSNIADRLTAEGMLPKKANAIAAEAYRVVSQGANKYMKRNMPEPHKAFLIAQKTAAKNFDVRDADAIVAMRNGDAQGVLDAIVAEGGKGPSFKSIQKYADFLGEAANPNDTASVAAAEGAKKAFLNDFFGIARDGVVDGAMNKASGSNMALDPKKLAATLGKLEAEGFPVESLGLGSRQQISALARLTTGRNQAGFTIDEVGKFLEDSKAIGINPAAQRVEYNRELRRLAMQGGISGIQKQGKRLKALQQAAKLDDEGAQAALNAAMNDDLVMFLNDTKMKLSRDPAQNADYARKLLSMDASLVRQFMGKIESSGRTASANQLREAVATDVMKSMLKSDPSGGLHINTQAAFDFFQSTDNQKQRATMQAVLGDDRWFSLLNDYGSALQALNRTLDTVKGKQSSIMSDVQQGARGRLPIRGTGGALIGSVATNLKSVVDLVKGGQYKILYKVLIDPEWAPKFKAAGGDLEKFASQPVNATALRLWAEEDAANAAAP